MLRDVLLARLADMGDSPDYVRLASEVLGIRGASADLARRLVAQALVVEDRRERWRRVGARVRDTLPETPGVYVLRDVERRVLYVGKATNLRRRIASHFAERRWYRLHPAMARVADVEWQEVGSEIEALLREAMLIETLRPEANVQSGRPSLGRRAIRHSVLNNAVLVLPSVEPDMVELIAARVDGPSMLRRTPRAGASLCEHARELWGFFQRAVEAAPAELRLAPLIFSWLSGRGAGTTRVDPGDAVSEEDFRDRLEMLLSARQLFSERLIAYRRRSADLSRSLPRISGDA